MYVLLLSRHSYNIVFFYQILLNITDIDSHMTNRKIFDLSVQSSIFFFFWFCRMYHLLNVFLSRINMVLFQGFFLWANGFLHHKLTKKCDSHFSVDLKQILFLKLMVLKSCLASAVIEVSFNLTFSILSSIRISFFLLSACTITLLLAQITFSKNSKIGNRKYDFASNPTRFSYISTFIRINILSWFHSSKQAFN